MKTPVIVFVLVFVAGGIILAQQNVVKRVSSKHEQIKCEFVVLQEDLDRAPQWAEKQDAPPLSPRAAVRAAEKYVSGLVTNTSRWEVNRVELQRVGHRGGQWIYEIAFIPDQGQMVLLTGLPLFRVPVLMDGSIPSNHVTLVREPSGNNK